MFSDKNFTNFITFDIASMSMQGCQIATSVVEPGVNYLKKGPSKTVKLYNIQMVDGAEHLISCR